MSQCEGVSHVHDLRGACSNMPKTIVTTFYYVLPFCVTTFDLSKSAPKEYAEMLAQHYSLCIALQFGLFFHVLRMYPWERMQDLWLMMFW